MSPSLNAIFSKRFGGEPDIVGRAPGRVNLIGEHTDYNDGFVFPIAIDRDIRIAARRRSDGNVHLHSVNYRADTTFPVDSLNKDPNHPWADFPKGVMAELGKAGHTLCGWEAVITGNVPLGAGLSSSAAFEVAAAYVLCSLNEIPFDAIEMALLCQRAENQFVGVQCGIMDQFISALGKKDHALLLDCRDLSYRHVPIDSRRVSVVICNSGVHRGLVDSQYNTRRSQCEQGVELLSRALPGIRALRDVSLAEFDAHQALVPEIVRKRCRHIVAENQRVLDAVYALENGDVGTFGRLMDASHVSLRDDYQVSIRELDLLVDLAHNSEGVLGARLTGAGFGGCTVNLVACDRIETFVRSITEAYRKETGILLETTVCAIAPGAGEVKA
ncbi:MAG: galactokinase [Candidatus Latescibacterota bacterium]